MLNIGLQSAKIDIGLAIHHSITFLLLPT